MSNQIVRDIREGVARRHRRTLAIRLVRLEDAWALRSLVVCVRRLEDLPVHARRLVEDLRQPA